MQLGDDRQNQAHHVQPGPLAVTTNPQSRKHPLTLSSKKNFTSSDLKVTLHISAHFFAFRRKQPAFSELLPASGCLTFCSSFYVNRVSNNEHLRQLINGKISILLFFSMHYVHCDNFCDKKKIHCLFQYTDKINGIFLQRNSNYFLEHCGKILAHSSWKIIFSPLWWTRDFKILYKCSLEFKSGDWWHHAWSSPVIPAVCLESSSCWNVHLTPGFGFVVGEIHASFNEDYCLQRINPMQRIMMLPPRCFTVGMVFLGSYTPSKDTFSEHELNYCSRVLICWNAFRCMFCFCFFSRWILCDVQKWRWLLIIPADFRLSCSSFQVSLILVSMSLRACR